jgi:hypothetical protein
MRIKPILDNGSASKLGTRGPGTRGGGVRDQEDQPLDVTTLLDEWWAWKRPSSSVTAIVSTEHNLRFLKRDLGAIDVDDVKV